MRELIANLVLRRLGFLDFTLRFLKLGTCFLQASVPDFLFFSRGLELTAYFFKCPLRLIDVITQLAGRLFDRLFARVLGNRFGYSRRYDVGAGFRPALGFRKRRGNFW